MSENTNIEWTSVPGYAGATWNPIAGCSIVSPGCHNCYAMRMAARLEAMGQKKYSGTTKDGRWTGKITFDEKALTIPLRTKKPTAYFVNSMTDLFHESVKDEWIDAIFAVMALCPQHVFQVLTKRAERMKYYFHFARQGLINDAARIALDRHIWVPKGYPHDLSAVDGPEWLLPNVWLGVSVEDQKRADERIPYLLTTPAAVRFLSCEPLLGPIHLSPWFDNGGIDWCIAGGESGPDARPCNVEWHRPIVRQSRAAADVAVFIKQLGSHVIDHRATSADTEPEDECWPDGTRTDGNRVFLRNRKGCDPAEWPADLRVRQFPGVRIINAGPVAGP